MSRKVVVLLLTFFVFFSLARLVCASSYAVEFYQEDTKVLVKEFINLDSSGQIDITLPNDSRSISANGPFNQTGNVLRVSGKDIVVSYITDTLIDSGSTGYYFSYKLEPFSGASSKVSLYLKEGFGFDSENIYPKGYNITSDGRAISAHWSFEPIPHGENIPIFVKLDNFSGSSFYNWILLIIAILVLGVGAWLYAGRSKSNRVVKKAVQKKSAPDYTSYLAESEANVVQELRKAENREMWQKQLQIATGFSKAKMSRVVRNLESRDIVEKIPFGNTNKVRLKK